MSLSPSGKLIDNLNSPISNVSGLFTVKYSKVDSNYRVYVTYTMKVLFLMENGEVVSFETTVSGRYYIDMIISIFNDSNAALLNMQSEFLLIREMCEIKIKKLENVPVVFREEDGVNKL